MTTIVYADGFNLYYGLKSRWPKYRWLDIQASVKACCPAATSGAYDILPRW